MKSRAIRRGRLKLPQIIESHCQLNTAPIQCVVSIPNVPAEKIFLGIKLANITKLLTFSTNEYEQCREYVCVVSLYRIQLLAWYYFLCLPIAGITARRPLRLGVAISIVYLSLIHI